MDARAHTPPCTTPDGDEDQESTTFSASSRSTSSAELVSETETETDPLSAESASSTATVSTSVSSVSLCDDVAEAERITEIDTTTTTTTAATTTATRKVTQKIDFGEIKRAFQVEPDSAASEKVALGSEGLTSSTPEQGEEKDEDDESTLWYILTTALLLAFHKEHLISDLWLHLSRDITSPPSKLQRARQHHQQTSQTVLDSEGEDEDEDDDATITLALVHAALRLRSACLKASTLVGFPRAINALTTLHSTMTQTHPTLLSHPLLLSSAPQSPFSGSASQPLHDRGMSLFSRIYASHTPRVLSTLGRCSNGALSDFAVDCIYGALLSDASVTSDRATGLLEFACCLADGVAPQAKGHFFGAANLGATNDVLAACVTGVETVAVALGVQRPWRDEGEGEGEGGPYRGEWAFLRRVCVF